MKILICPCTDKQKSITALPSVISKLKDLGIMPMLAESVRKICIDERAEYVPDESAVDVCDMVMTIGGDGMILKWGRKAAAAGKPLVGINTGRVGFMTALGADELDRLSALADGTYTVSRRMMLSADIPMKDGVEEFRALNDIVLYKDANVKLPEFTVKSNGTTVLTVRADGMIFSTPTGSTAYALSAGGTIIEPTLECIELTPLCPHTLFSRPMVFGGNDTITVSYARYERCYVNISVDGSSNILLEPDTEVVIRRSPVTFELVETGEKSFYGAIAKNLMASLK
ncbi:MAG: NAD(+)/NADH kinase [Ruminiclostridium sp.]|nr:NAD(+)/NADH kinase [Ruminiclostridium sp.]